MKQLVLETLLRNKQELGVLITANGVTWLSAYFIPIVGALTAVVSLATTLYMFVREYKLAQKQKHNLTTPPKNDKAA